MRPAAGWQWFLWQRRQRGRQTRLIVAGSVPGGELRLRGGDRWGEEQFNPQPIPVSSRPRCVADGTVALWRKINWSESQSCCAEELMREQTSHVPRCHCCCHWRCWFHLKFMIFEISTLSCLKKWIRCWSELNLHSLWRPAGGSSSGLTGRLTTLQLTWPLTSGNSFLMSVWTRVIRFKSSLTQPDVHVEWNGPAHHAQIQTRGPLQLHQLISVDSSTLNVINHLFYIVLSTSLWLSGVMRELCSDTKSSK